MVNVDVYMRKEELEELKRMARDRGISVSRLLLKAVFVDGVERREEKRWKD